MEQEAFQQIANSIPLEPGIYKYFDSRKELLYVGKAKNLRARLLSYFRPKSRDPKAKTNAVVGFLRGVCVAIEWMQQSHAQARKA